MLEYLRILGYSLGTESDNALGADNQQGRPQLLIEEPSETTRQARLYEMI